MEPWVFREPDRFRRERDELTALTERCSWLVGHQWQLTNEGLYVDVVVTAHGYDYELRVTFPTLFPDAPAVVRPLNEKERLSSHQYGGPDGPLCLQWGPDNWHRDVTAAALIESAYELLATENPRSQADDQLGAVVPSRHFLTLGQEIRGKWARWYRSPAFASYVGQSGKAEVGWFRFSFRDLAKEQWVALVHEAATISGEKWIDDSVPANLPEANANYWLTGVWFHAQVASARIAAIETVSDLAALLPDTAPPNLLAMDGTSPIEGMQRWLAGAAVQDDEGQLHLVAFFSDGRLFRFGRIDAHHSETTARTLNVAALSARRIGVVGLGSAGSKLTASLARMGARNFYLVDHDVFLPENIQRNALDWQGVGMHKVDAVARALSLISPDAKVDCSRLHLTGQESSAAVAAALSRLAECDVIVDATASTRAFNVLSAVARGAKRPFLWLEIFGGGIGGLVGRSRPNIDIDAQAMRLVYLSYCESNPAPASIRTANRYEADPEGGSPITSSDADVSILASHAANLLVDSFLPASDSKYPHSIYLVGLTRGWVFREPFDTIPLATPAFCATAASGPSTNESENLAFLRGLLQKSE